MKARKSWREKLADDKDLPKVVKIPPEGRAKWKGATLVVPAPREVDALMQKVPKGKVVTINELRAALARAHGTEVGCPITTGIFSWIAANAAAEAAAEGKKRVTPYWRTLKVGGELNPKYPGGVESLRQMLEAEGHKVIQKGKKFVVADYQKALVAQEKLA